MATDAADRITTYYLALPETQRQHLGGLRHLEGLSMATEGGLIWVKGFTEAQADSVAVQSLPFKKLYAARGGKLFVPGHLLPAGAEPVLLWTPIQRALPLRLPEALRLEGAVADALALTLVADSGERPPEALLLPLPMLGRYVADAPSLRLQRLRWVLLQKEALLLGTPLLPLPGIPFWRQESLLLPAGYRLSQPLLAGVLQQRLDPQGERFILARPEGSWPSFDRSLLRPLTRSSFRKSITEGYE